MIEEIKKTMIESMRNSVNHLLDEFGSIRSGRAHSGMVERIVVEYYGSQVPLQQLASFSTPEPRQLVISPFDKGALSAIEKAIQISDLGVNPGNDGSILRLNFPPLTEERRKELVKVAKSKAEEARISARNARRAARQELEKLEKDAQISKDDLERSEKEFDKLTQDIVSEVDNALSVKEAELMEV